MCVCNLYGKSAVVMVIFLVTFWPVHTGRGAPCNMQHAHKLWNTLWSMGVFTQVAATSKGLHANLREISANPSCVKGGLIRRGRHPSFPSPVVVDKYPCSGLGLLTDQNPRIRACLLSPRLQCIKVVRELLKPRC